MAKNQKFFKWHLAKKVYEQDFDAEDINSLYMKEFSSWIMQILPFRCDIDSDKIPFEIDCEEYCETKEWADKNLEGKWSFIMTYKNDVLIMSLFFEKEKDLLNFILTKL